MSLNRIQFEPEFRSEPMGTMVGTARCAVRAHAERAEQMVPGFTRYPTRFVAWRCARRPGRRSAPPHLGIWVEPTTLQTAVAIFHSPTAGAVGMRNVSRGVSALIPAQLGRGFGKGIQSGLERPCFEVMNQNKLGKSKMAGVAGLEPVTSAVTGQRSNQLSYTPAKGKLRLNK